MVEVDWAAGTPGPSGGHGRADGQGDDGGGGRSVVPAGQDGAAWWSAAAAQSMGRVILHGGGSSVLVSDPFAVQECGRLLCQAASGLQDAVAAVAGARLELAGQSELALTELSSALASLERVGWQAASASQEAADLAGATYRSAALLAEVERSATSIFTQVPIHLRARGRWQAMARRNRALGAGRGTWYKGSVSQPALQAVSAFTDTAVFSVLLIPHLVRRHSVSGQIRRWLEQVEYERHGGRPGLYLRDPAAGVLGRERGFWEMLDSVGTGSLTAGVPAWLYGLPNAAVGLEPHMRVLPTSPQAEAGPFFPLVLAGGAYTMDRSQPFGAKPGEARTVGGQVALELHRSGYGSRQSELAGKLGQACGEVSGPAGRACGQAGQAGGGAGGREGRRPSLITGVALDGSQGAGGGGAALPTPGRGQEVQLPRTLQEHVKMLEELPRREGSMLVGVLESRQGVTVYINGTNAYSPITTSPTSMESNLELAAGIRSDSERTVIAALEYAGVQPGTNVTLVGHSQGGIVAAAIASDPLLQSRYGVDNVITFASPLGYSKVPPEVSVIAVENVDDFVPALDGRVNANLPNVVTATVDTRHVDLGFVHSLPEMGEAARLVDAYPDADLQQRIARVHGAMVAGQGPAAPALTGRLTVLEGRLLPALSDVPPRWPDE